MREHLTVAMLAVSNLAGAVVSKTATWAEAFEPYLHFLIGVGQIAVAVVTVWYIVKKIRHFSNKEDKE